MSSKVQKIDLPKGEVPAGTAVIISGFGSNEMNGKPSTQLKKVETKTLSWEECRKQSHRQIPDGVVCSVSKVLDKEKNIYAGACSVSRADLFGFKNQSQIS